MEKSIYIIYLFDGEFHKKSSLASYFRIIVAACWISSVNLLLIVAFNIKPAVLAELLSLDLNSL